MNVEAGTRNHIISQDCDFIWVAPALWQWKKMQQLLSTILEYSFSSSLDQIDFDVKKSAKEEMDVFLLWDQLSEKGGQ